MRKWLLYLIVLLIPLRSVTFLQYSHSCFHVLNVAIGVLFLFSVVEISVGRNRMYASRLTGFIIFINLIIILLSAMNPRGFYSTLYGDLYIDFLFSSMLLLTLIWRIKDLRDIKMITFMIFIGGIFQAFLVFYQHLTGKGFLDLGNPLSKLSTEASGTFTNPAVMAEYMFIAICATLTLLLSRGGTKKYVYSFFSIAFYAAIIIGQSRTMGAIALLAPAVVLLLLQGITRAKKVYITCMICFPVIATVWMALGSKNLEKARVAYIGKFTRGFAEQRVEGVFGIRTSITRAGLDMFVENPLFGKGFGTFSYYSAPYVEKYIKTSTYSYHNWEAHNYYIQLLVEIGLVGFIPFLVILSIGLKNYRQAWRVVVSRGDMNSIAIVTGYRACFWLMLLAMYLGYGRLYHIMMIIGLSVALKRIFKGGIN